MVDERRLKWLFCCQLFLIVPGLQPERTLPNWSNEFASYTNATSNTPVRSFKPEKCVVNLTGNIIPNSPDILIFDWSALSSWEITSVKSPKIVEPFAKAFDEKVGIIFKRTNEKVPVVAAGHSRGVPAILAMLAELKNPKDPKKEYKALSRISSFVFIGLDPFKHINDGDLVYDPQIIDWTVVYYQTLQLGIDGHSIPGALNINLDAVLGNMTLLPGENRHKQVHRYYRGLLNPGNLKSGELLNLYGGNPNQDGEATGPIIEFFNYGNGGIFFNFAQGKLEKPIPSPFTRLYNRDEIGLNMVRNHALEMTDNRAWVAAGLAFRSVIEGGFTIEFTVWMKDRLQTRSNLGGGDGMVFYLRDADQEPSLALGGAGGGMGYMGLANNGFAIAFDTFRNKEHGDTQFTGSRLSLRLAGKVGHRMLTEMNLPAPLNSGTPFRVRLSLGTGRKIAIKVYSFAADKSVDIIEDLPTDVDIPRRKILGFTASTGTAAQRHILDDIILVPHGK